MKKEEHLNKARRIEMSEIATRNLRARSKRAISEHAQKHAPSFSSGSVFDKSVERLDREEDWELVVEGIYGAAQQYISYICDSLLGEHHETHKGLIRYLKEHNLSELADKFQRLDELRIGKWYGNQVNGETVDLALEVLKEIKDTIKDVK